MGSCSRRSILSAMGATLPLGLGSLPAASVAHTGIAPSLQFQSFEDAVRAAFAERSSDPGRRVEIGHSELVRVGVQGCHNDRPFAGFPAGHLRIVRTGSEPGAVCLGVRLYVATVDVMLTGGLSRSDPSRPLDFASLPPAPTFSRGHAQRA